MRAPQPAVVVRPPELREVLRADVFHRVAPGETVWRLAKTYDVTPEEIMRANRIERPEDLKMGQQVRIPRAAPPNVFIPLYPSRKWQYIIIHHSATDSGDALTFHDSHFARGFDHGLGYHFVIDNGTLEKDDGYIEVSPRWLRQQDGAHCKASNMNAKGIGICLVGNFSRDQVSKKQLDSLVFLVDKLRRYYNIPFWRIMGHGQVAGAATECPGKNFPWEEFNRRLRSAR